MADPRQGERLFPPRPLKRTDKRIDDDLVIIARELGRYPPGSFMFDLLAHARDVLTGWKVR